MGWEPLKKLGRAGKMAATLKTPRFCSPRSALTGASRRLAGSLPRGGVELGIVAEDPRRVEGNAALRGEIGRDVFLRSDRLRQRREPWIKLAGVREGVRERVSHALPDLKQ